MQIEDWLFSQGVASYTQTFVTKITAEQKIMIAQDMPKIIGRIYGISTLDGGLTGGNRRTLPDDVTKLVVPLADLGNYYLTFKYSSVEYYDAYALDQLLFGTFGNGVQTNQKKYLQVDLPGDTDLQQSFFKRADVSKNVGDYLVFTFWYIPTGIYIDMMNDGLIGRNGKFNKPK